MDVNIDAAACTVPAASPVLRYDGALAMQSGDCVRMLRFLSCRISCMGTSNPGPGGLLSAETHVVRLHGEVHMSNVCNADSHFIHAQLCGRIKLAPLGLLPAEATLHYPLLRCIWIDLPPSHGIAANKSTSWRNAARLCLWAWLKAGTLLQPPAFSGGWFQRQCVLCSIHYLHKKTGLNSDSSNDARPKSSIHLPKPYQNTCPLPLTSCTAGDMARSIGPNQSPCKGIHSGCVKNKL